ncbi:MAG TPA: helix-turn-helix domain-containing protein [Roseomonas sp.]|jgi:AraC-like DNA-binding protein/mannose-6-phosphate isomerase-like protein (cupin superfamily)
MLLIRAMARHIRAEQIEGVARPIVAVGNEYPDGHRHPPHRHRRSQLLFAACGTMLVQTDHGAWMVPPNQGMWIPGGTLHGITMLGRVATRSVYLEPEAAAGLSPRCQVLGIAPLLRQLLIEAVDLPADYAPDSRAGRIMALLIDEIAAAPALPLSLPLPRDGRLALRCRAFLERPNLRDSIDAWSKAVALSRRSFTRTFRRETGLSFAAWQRRACVLTALPRLLRGERVTTIAFDLGCSSPAAFTALFRSVMGVAPSHYGRGSLTAPSAAAMPPAAPPSPG